MFTLQFAGSNWMGNIIPGVYDSKVGEEKCGFSTNIKNIKYLSVEAGNVVVIER